MSLTEGPRILSKSISNGVIIGAAVSGDEWNYESSGSYAYWEGYIDLHGYRPDDMTFFPGSVQIQRGGGMQAAAAYTGFIEELTILHTVPWTLPAGVGWIGDEFPGHLESTLSSQYVVYYEYRLYYVDPNVADTVIPKLMQSNTGGMGSPTATNKLHITRVINTSASGSEIVTIPSVNVVVGGMVTEEPEITYMHRLARSFELYQGTDVDV
jgi:hypothetical protein